MDPFTMAKQLLGDVELTPGQLAQLRAINTKYYTELFALEHRAPSEGRARGAAPEPKGSPAARASAVTASDMATLDARIAADIRDMLTEEQRTVLDRNLPRVLEREVERAVAREREGRAPAGGAPRAATRGPRRGARPSGPDAERS